MRKIIAVLMISISVGSVFSQGKKIYTGKPISLHFQGIAVPAVLQLIADFTHINVVVSDKVEGNITLRLQDIPWDQALDIILTTQGLDKRRVGNWIWVDTKEHLDAMEEAQLKNQQRIEKIEPVLSDLFQINYAKAGDLVNLVKDKQNSLLSEKGKISADGRTNMIWIQDTPQKVEEVRLLIKQLDIPVKQVLIEARLVEVSKDFSQDIGIKWAVSRPPSLGKTLANAGSLASGAQEAVPNLTKLLNLDLIATPAYSGSPATVGIALAKISEKILLDLELSALESEGRAELISSPKLIARDQQPALIESGQEIPYQETTSTGATTVAFKKAVLSLKVTPHITSDNKILMDLQINQGSASPLTVNGVPAILTKEIQTNILVNNGQTIVLGGIYIRDKAKTINRIPFLGDLPLIGKLFINKQINWKNDEMLIFITPKIISSSLGTVK